MKKLLPFIITLLALSLLASCGGNGEDTTAAPVADETTEAPAPDISLIANGASEYKLVRSANASSRLTDAFAALRIAIRDKYGVTLQIMDDFEKPGTDPASRHPYEILVGSTNREESSSALEGLGYNDSVIAVVGDRIVITGGNDDAVIRAIERFKEIYLTEGSISLAGNLRDVENADYPKPGVTLGGVPLSDHTIVYSSSYQSFAKELAHRLGMLTGARIEIVLDRDPKPEHTIEIGTSAFIKDIGVDDFVISKTENGLSLNAGNKTALGMACAELAQLIEDSGKTAFETSELALTYTLPTSRDYIDDIESLPMHWAIEFDTPEWMLDFDEKYAATIDPAGRLMSCAHRGDMVYYPENSIEGIISSILMGADMVEIDPRKTKDGVFILLHDETLTRTTNVADMAGKNGLPTSHKVSDWTYKQLMQLNLKEKSGGSSANVTVYKIPTLEEAIKVCANRIYIRLDVKGPEGSSTPFWNYERDIWPLMEKYESYSNVIFTWHSWFKDASYKIPTTYRAKAEALGAYPAPIFVSDANTLSATMRPIRSYEFNPGVRLGCNFADYSYKTYLKDNASKLNGYKGKIRTYADIHNTNSAYPENKESFEFYGELYEGGINYQLVNKALLLCQYIAQNFEPADHVK